MEKLNSVEIHELKMKMKVTKLKSWKRKCRKIKFKYF